MTNELINFTYENHDIRTVMIDGQPWWVLKDVCDALEIVNSRDVAKRLDDDEVRVVSIYTEQNTTREANVVNEPGLYGVIMQSRKPEAKAFKRWIKHEVLPQIRRTGSYGQAQMPAVITADYLQAVTDHLRQLEQRTTELETLTLAQGQQIAEMQPKANYYDLILQSKDPVCITTIAKDYGMSAQQMNQLLHDLHVQYRLPSGQWLLYQDYADKGYTKTRTHSIRHADGTQGSKVHTYWTQKGRIFLFEFLRERGILPLMERPEVETVNA